MVIGSSRYKNKNEIRRNVHKLAFSPDFVSKYTKAELLKIALVKY